MGYKIKNGVEWPVEGVRFGMWDEIMQALCKLVPDDPTAIRIDFDSVQERDRCLASVYGTNRKLRGRASWKYTCHAPKEERYFYVKKVSLNGKGSDDADA